MALRPFRRPQVLGVFLFFGAWLTTELALLLLVGQVIGTIAFIAAGALDDFIGWVALGITVLSACGLLAIVSISSRTEGVFAKALAETLGPEWATLDPDQLATRRPMEWSRVAFPFRWRRAGVQRTRNIQYVAGDKSKRHRLDIFRSANTKPGAPVLLQIHGGAWIISNKDQQGLPLVYHMAERGWICVSINYALSPRAAWPNHLIDCKRALAWVHEHIAEYGGDPNFVVVTGGSAGGHLTAMMALTANDPRFQPGFESADTSVRGMVPFYGVYDWTNRYGQRGRRDGMRRFLERTVVKKAYADAQDVFEIASPMSHVRADAPPALIIHGDLDTLAPVAEARAFVRDLRAVSTSPVVYAELQGAHHAFEVFQSVRTMQTLVAVDRFLTWLVLTEAATAKPATNTQTQTQSA